MEPIKILQIIAAVAALLVAIIGHEIMHGYIAYKYGDTTAKDAGRLSLNPIIHIDPIGSILVPLVLYFVPMLLGAGSGFIFGWAKPVPINVQTVINKGGYNAAMQVSLAGIAYNFVMAAFAAMVLLVLHIPTTADSLFYILLYSFVMQLVIINVVLGVFNLLPIPQLDGAHFLMYLALKFQQYKIAETFYRLERYGMIIVLIILVTPLKDYLLIMPVNFILSLLLS
jgi:Zn-dependent protease